jgi:hypothetical protein
MKKEFYLPMRTHPDTYEEKSSTYQGGHIQTLMKKEFYPSMRTYPDTYEERVLSTNEDISRHL